MQTDPGAAFLQGDISARKMIFGVEGVDPRRRDDLIELLDIDLRWRLNVVSDGQRRRVQICMGLLRPYQVSVCGPLVYLLRRGLACSASESMMPIRLAQGWLCSTAVKSCGAAAIAATTRCSLRPKLWQDTHMWATQDAYLRCGCPEHLQYGCRRSTKNWLLGTNYILEYFWPSAM